MRRRIVGLAVGLYAADPASAIDLLPPPTQQCEPTTTVRLRADGVLQSFHGSTRKSVGGDEFHATIVRDGRDIAVARISDQADGSYSLSFARVEWPAPAGQPSAEALQVVLVFTCGTGALGPPAKQGWNSSGWIRRRIPLMLAAHLPPLSTLVPPAVPMPAAAIDLRRFAAFAAIGDSTVRQFRPLIQEKRPLNFSYTDASGSMLDRFSPELGSSKVCEEAAERALKAQGGVSHGARQLVLYGSGAWDLVDESKTALTTASEYQAAFTQCLRQIKRRFPGATFVLKAFFMMHPLRVDCERASALCANKMWGASSCGERCYARTKYMSASRSQRLFELQRAAAAAEGFATLDALNDLTVRHAHWTAPGDGMHFSPTFNDFLWSHTFEPRCLQPPPVRKPVSLVHQHSQARCVAGRSFGLVAGLERRVMWVRNCRGLFRCRHGPILECGFPPGAPAYNCSCDGSDSDLYRWPCKREGGRG